MLADRMRNQNTLTLERVVREGFRLDVKAQVELLSNALTQKCLYLNSASAPSCVTSGKLLMPSVTFFYFVKYGQ